LEVNVTKEMYGAASTVFYTKESALEEFVELIKSKGYNILSYKYKGEKINPFSARGVFDVPPNPFYQHEYVFVVET
jgi:hypothetical protein